MSSSHTPLKGTVDFHIRLMNEAYGSTGWLVFSHGIVESESKALSEFILVNGFLITKV